MTLKQIAQEIKAVQKPKTTELLAAIQRLDKRRMSEVLGALTTCNRVSFLRRMIIWELKRGPVTRRWS